MKIKISDEAAENLVKLLKQHTEYNCVRLSLIKSRCGHGSVEVVLDELDLGKKVEQINGLSVMYDDELEENMNEIELAFKNNGFVIKAVPKNQAKKGCSSSGCGGGCCGECGK
jgi:Fe-S cluster assembly iron-binding protein IscA